MTDWRDEAKALAAQSKAMRRIGARNRNASRRAISVVEQANEQRLARVTLGKATSVS